MVSMRLLTLSLIIGIAVASRKCGYLPKEVTLKRGERQSLVFWTDQNYDSPPEENEDAAETTTKDYFLEAVNAGSKPVKEEEQSVEVKEEVTTNASPIEKEETTTEFVRENDESVEISTIPLLDVENYDELQDEQTNDEVTEDDESSEATESVQEAENEFIGVTEAAETGEATEAAETGEATEAAETIEVTEAAETIEVTEAAETLEVTEAAETIEVTGAAEIVEATETAEVTEAAETVEAAEIEEVSDTEAAEKNEDDETSTIFNQEELEAATIIPELFNADLEQETADEILDDDDYSDDEKIETTTSMEHFVEDFGTLVHENEESIYDPLDDIADVTEGNHEIPEHVELLEVSDFFETTTFSNIVQDEIFDDDTDKTYTTIVPYDILREFDDTTIAFPTESSSSSTTVKIEAVEAEVETTDRHGLFQDTTTDSPNEKEQPAANGLVNQPTFAVEAVVAEEDYDSRPDFTATDANGNFIETTTGATEILRNKVAIVSKTVATKELEKAPRGADEDLEDMLDIQVLDPTESPSDLITNITDPSDKPGSILTTLIDGFLLQKQPQEEKPVESVDGFPVTNILSGIYNFVSSVIQPADEVSNVDDVESYTAIPQSAINVHNMPRDQLIVEAIAGPLPLDAPNDSKDAPPLPLLPAEFLRGAPISNKPRKQKLPNPKKPVFFLNENTREPVSIPIPDLISGEPRSFDPIESLRTSDRHFKQFILGQPLEVREHFIQKRDVEDITTTILPEIVDSEDVVNCSWNIKTEPGLYLLATFHNLSAPYTVECEGAYIEVERENNGFEARWCGNRVTTGGSRPHVIFAKNEVRITVFDDGSQNKELPTGFSTDIEVIDLFDGQQHSEALKNIDGYSNVRKLTGRTVTD